MGIMQDAGYLDGNGKLTPGAKEVFFRHREDIVNGVQNPLLPDCVISEKNENLIADARDEDQYYSFHVNWVNGMYNTCLKILDRESNISLLAPPDPTQPKGIIFDIVALSKKINKPIVTPIPPEQAGIPVITSLFAAPPPANLTLAAPFFGIVDPVLLTEFISTTPVVAPGLYIPPIPSEFIPDIPSEAYPELEAPSLSSKQETLYTAVCQSLNILVAEINLFPATYITPLGIETEAALKILYEKACSILSTTLPKPSVENAASFIVNFGTLQRSLTKPLALAALGVTIGSDKTGFIGRLKKVEPDAVGNYVQPSEAIGQENAGFTEVNSVLLVPGLRNTTPQFRTELLNVAKRLGVNVDWLAMTMSFETGQSFNPRITNKDSGAVGLIQFTGPAAKEVGTTLRDLKKMSAVEQLVYVERYYQKVIKSFGQPKSLEDTYLLVFTPAFVKNPNFSYEEPSASYKQNKGFDNKPKDSKITKPEIASTISNRYLKAKQSKKRISTNSDEIIEVA